MSTSDDQVAGIQWGDPFSGGVAVVLPLLVSLAIAICLTQVATFSTTIYLHRCATHRAPILHPGIAWLFRFTLWVTTGLSTKEWVAVHRKHHAFTDQDGDPHSPVQKGFWPVQLGNVFYYVPHEPIRPQSHRPARHATRRLGSLASCELGSVTAAATMVRVRRATVTSAATVRPGCCKAD